MPIIFFWSVNRTQFFQEIGKTKFHAIKICSGPSAHHICELLLDMCLECNFAPSPNKNRVKSYLKIKWNLKKIEKCNFRGALSLKEIDEKTSSVFNLGPIFIIFVKKCSLFFVGFEL